MIFYRLPFLTATNTITAGPDKRIKAAAINCPITCQFIGEIYDFYENFYKKLSFKLELVIISYQTKNNRV